MDRNRLITLVEALDEWASSHGRAPVVNVEAVVERLLRDQSTEMAAAVGALLERTQLRVARDGGDASLLVRFANASP